MSCFEKVSKYANIELEMPTRGTAEAAGYDLVCADDAVIPSYHALMAQFSGAFEANKPLTLEEMAHITKNYGLKPTLVSTGMKCKLDPGTYLEISVRSSTPLKYWLVLANGVGIIDADYYNNTGNEGEIFLQLINFSPFPIHLTRGDKIGQGIIKPYLKVEGDAADGERTGGFGSTSE